MKIVRLLALAAVLALGAADANAQDFEKGLKAYNSGDYQKALNEWKPLAERGDALSQYNLGHLYINGYGVVQNYAAGTNLYFLAAKQGYSPAQASLATSYEIGMGVPKDIHEALNWWILAAKQGNANAQNMLGIKYQYGFGVLEDNVRAHMWYNLASASGDTHSAKQRTDIAKKMTPEAVEKAQAMASECLSSVYENCGW